MSCWDILVHCWISCITGRNIPWGGLAANAGVGDIWDQFSTQDSTVSHQSPLDQAFDFNTSLLLLPLNFTKSRTVDTFALIGKYGAIYKIPKKRIFWANIVQNCQSRFYRIGPRLFLKPNSSFGKINQKQRGQNRRHIFLQLYSRPVNVNCNPIFQICCQKECGGQLLLSQREVWKLCTKEREPAFSGKESKALVANIIAFSLFLPRSFLLWWESWWILAERLHIVDTHFWLRCGPLIWHFWASSEVGAFSGAERKLMKE